MPRYKHGNSKHAMFPTWKQMPQRASRCERWSDFKTFLSDVAFTPELRRCHELRRLDTKKPWGPDNFRWGPIYTRLLSPAAQKDRKRDYLLNYNYGISQEVYALLLEKQGGTCAICKKPESLEHTRYKTFRLSVDHCHDTGAVRGLLCKKCNFLIGGLDVNALRAAIDYLERHRT